jgi:hypothetical protein
MRAFFIFIRGEIRILAYSLIRLRITTTREETMIDTEELLSLTEAAKLLPRRRAGKPAHVSCLYRWTQIGCRGVRLEFVQVGATRCTSREALSRFFAALSTQAEPSLIPPPPTAALTATRRKAIEAAEKRLAQAAVRTATHYSSQK